MGAILPPFEVSVKPGLAHPDPLLLFIGELDSVAIAVVTPNVCEEFSRANLKDPSSALDRRDSC